MLYKGSCTDSFATDSSWCVHKRMSGSCKLYYFPFKGLGEPSRLILAHAGIQYENIRVEFEKWPEFKPQTPFGIMPVLVEDGKMLAGSIVIARYLGEKYGLAGSNAWENTQIASIVDFMEDFRRELTDVHFEKDEEKKASLKKRFIEEVAPKYLSKLDSLAGESGYLWNNKLTWADIRLHVLLDLMGDNVDYGSLSGLKQLKKNVEEASKGIAKYLKERPVTPY